MHHEDLNDLLVLKIARTDDGTDYVFRTVRDLFSIDRPIRAMRGRFIRQELPVAQEWPVAADIAPGIEAISRLDETRWSQEPSRLIVPSAETAAAVTAILGQDRRCTLSPWSAFHSRGMQCYRSSLESVADDIPVIVVDHACADWIPGEQGWSAFREFIGDPVAHGGRHIGEGSEGIVYAVRWAGRDCALKVVNREAQKAFDDLSRNRNMGYFTPHFRMPDFLERVGFLPWVMSIVDDIPDLPFTLTGIRDYAFGHRFHLMELAREAMPLSELMPKDRARSDEAETFLRAHDITERQLKDVGQVLRRIAGIVEAVRQAGWSDRRRLLHDMHPNNVLLRGVDAADGRLQLTLIDQGQAPPSFSDPAGVLEESYERRAYEDAERMYHQLMRDPAYGPFLKKHLPDGLPKRTFYA